MRRFFIFLVFTLIITTNVFSGDLIFGGSAGYNAGWFSGKDWNDFVDYYYRSNRINPGYTLGLFLDIGLSEYFSIQPELNFSSSGGRALAENLYVSSYDIYIDKELTAEAKMLSIPCLSKLKIKYGTNKWTFFGGPQLGILLGDLKNNLKISSEGYIPDTTNSDMEADNHLLFGILAGTGYEYHLRRDVFFTELRYSYFFNSFFDKTDTMLNNIEVKIGFGKRF